MRRIKSSPICMLICDRLKAILPVRAICVGMSLQVSTVEAMSSSNKDVYPRLSMSLMPVEYGIRRGYRTVTVVQRTLTLCARACDIASLVM